VKYFKQKRRSQRGLTLIEFMTVVVIMGILVSIGVVQLIHAKDRATNASVQANMHAFQNVVELYAVDGGGLYPLSVNNLLNSPELASSSVLYGMKNPITNRVGLNQAYQDEDTSILQKGIITLDTSNLSQYYIYGYNGKKERIVIKGQEFILSNG